MSFTYNSSQVGSSGLSTIRFYTGETSSSSAILTDEAINAVLDNMVTNHLLAAAVCADALAAHYADQADVENEGLTVKASQRAQAYERLSASLRRRAGQSAPIYVGGRSKQEKRDREGDSDLVQVAFSRTRDDFPGTSASTST